MGVISSVFNRLFGKKEVRILMYGLDAVGKTTILYKFKLGKIVTTIPTIGFNIETVEHNNIKFTMWDVGGGDKIRQLWCHYFHGANGVIFIVDSTDRDRIDEAKESLEYMLRHEEFRDAVVLVFANKQDLLNPMTAAEVSEALKMDSYQIRSWHVQQSSAKNGSGLYEGLDWLTKELES